jgi:hypothetical protein
VFRKPQEQLEVTPTTEVALHLDASDDFGLAKVGIEYQINGGAKRTLWEQDFEGNRDKLTTAPVLYLEDHQLNFDDAVTYYAFAEDYRGAAKRTRSELRFVDIRPYKREYQVVDGSCQGGGSCLSLEELIARQRHTLRRTFANLDRQPVQDQLAIRLSKSQQEILAATNEFASGWEQRFGPLPALRDAAQAMEDAAEKLLQKQLDPAMPLEETAVALLVSARQNVRKFLKNCTTGQFGQCQKYDNEMVQKLRAPKKSEQGEQSLAETRRQLRDLAQRERTWSEEVAAGSGGAQIERDASDRPPPAANRPSASGAKSSTGQTPSSLADAQQEAARMAEALERALRENATASQLSQARMQQIVETITASSNEMQRGDRVAAAEHALEAARQLDQLAEHLNGLGAADFTERLALAEQMASHLATGEGELAEQLQRGDSPAESKPSFAKTQRDLAGHTETLGDLIKHLEADALGEDAALRQQLGDLQDAQQPDELARDMRRVAKQIEAGQSEHAAGGARAAERGLAEIASQLGTIRRSLLQPQLDQLLAAEAQAAELLEKIRGGESQVGLAANFDRLQRELAKLNIAPPTEPGSHASSNSAASRNNSRSGAASRSATGSGDLNGTEPVFTYAGRNVNAELRQIITVLQSKIQDAILLTAKMDADEPIPPQYRALVDEYYQALSNDLR